MESETFEIPEPSRKAGSEPLWQERLPRARGRLLAFGWPETGSPPAGFEWERGRSDALGEIQGPWTAVLWFSPAAGPLGAKRARQVRELLNEKGRLLVVDRAPDPSSLEGDPLPKVLAEAGFAVLRRESWPEDDSLRLVTARRDPYVVRSFRAGDEEAILELFQTCFHPHRELAHWLWKYRDNPWGRQKISLACGPDGRPVAHYAGYPLPFHGAGGGSLSMQMGDTMVHPRERGTGRRSTSLLRRAVDHFFAAYSAPAVAFYYGFNTGGIRSFSLRFVRGRILEPVAFRRLELRGSRPQPARSYRIARAERTGTAWDRLFDRAAPAYGSMIRRDSAYLDWRYLRCPDVPYLLLAAYRWRRLVAWSVFRRMDEATLAWVDALCLPGHARAASGLLRAALDSPAAAGVTRVEAWFPDRPDFWHRELERLGFERLPQPDELALIYRPHAAPDLERTLSTLYYTMGDGDLY